MAPSQKEAVQGIEADQLAQLHVFGIQCEEQRRK